MGVFDRFKRRSLPSRDARMISDIPGINRPGADLLQLCGLGDVSLPAVTIESALTVPAVLAATTFLPRSLAALPLHAFRNTRGGPEKINGGIETLVHQAPNAEWTSFKLRQYFWTQVFTGGRGLIWIERSGSNITGMYPINPVRTKIKRDDTGRTTYVVGDKIYPAADVIDVPFMLKVDGVAHYGPITLGSKAIQLALAMNDYGSRFFAGGGVPPLALVGPMPQGAEALRRAQADIQRAIDAAKASDKPIFPMPPGHELKPVGFDPEKGQMTDARRFSVEEIARIYGLPPVFLQDLTHGTFSNTEQQDLHLVKHLISQWVEALEQEMNLKMFGQRNGGRYVEHNLDGLMRGDFLSRMEGITKAVAGGIMEPNRGRRLMNWPDHDNPAANQLYMQGATVPIGSQPAQPGAVEPASNEGTSE